MVSIKQEGIFKMTQLFFYQNMVVGGQNDYTKGLWLILMFSLVMQKKYIINKLYEVIVAKE